MDVIEAIRTRRSIAKFHPEPVPRDALMRILAAGIWAPNHHLTEPWQFAILGPESRRRMAVRYAELRMEKAPPEAVERRARIREESTRKFMEIPAIVTVAALQEGDEQRRREDYAATCCAIQNVQLAAWSEGIGVKWSTAPVIHDPLTYSLLELDPERYVMIALLYIGYPAEIPTRDRKRLLDDVIRITN
ncbi:MAG TPA: nitroreductase [Promineifilum sp.]|nr:nitroreductase [Promineifilum sp.]